MGFWGNLFNDLTGILTVGTIALILVVFAWAVFKGIQFMNEGK